MSTRGERDATQPPAGHQPAGAGARQAANHPAAGHQQAGHQAGAAGQHDDRDQEAANRALGLNTGWNVFGYLVGGMIAYGGIGWLIGRAVHVQLLFPIGMLIGLAISVGWVIYRYGTERGRIQMETGMSAAADPRTRRGAGARRRRGNPREEMIGDR